MSANGARRGTRAHALAADSLGVSLSEPLLDCEAAAKLLNVRVSRVRDAARLGQLPCLRVGRHLRFTRSMLEAWLAGQFSATHGSERAYRQQAGGVGGRSARHAFRASTQAALLASLAEQPPHAEADNDA
jgi:excisionase family DNA binding protein